MPTQALRDGDFTGLSTPTIIYDPTTGALLTAPDAHHFLTRQPSRLTRFRHRFLPCFLRQTCREPADIDNYFFSATQRLNRNNFDGKVDWNRTTNHSIFVKYSAMKSDISWCPEPGRGDWRLRLRRRTGRLPFLCATRDVGHTLTLSPTLVIDGNVGFTRMSEYGKTPDYGTNIGSDVLGLPGTNNGSDLRSSGFPYFAISGFADIGNPEGWNPAFRNDWSFTSSHNVRWSKGKHQFSAGTDIVHHHLNHWQPELGSGPRGEFDFDGNATALNGGDLPISSMPGHNFCWACLEERYKWVGQERSIYQGHGKGVAVRVFLRRPLSHQQQAHRQPWSALRILSADDAR